MTDETLKCFGTVRIILMMQLVFDVMGGGMAWVQMTEINSLKIKMTDFN